MGIFQIEQGSINFKLKTVKSIQRSQKMKPERSCYGY